MAMDAGEESFSRHLDEQASASESQAESAGQAKRAKVDEKSGKDSDKSRAKKEGGSGESEECDGDGVTNEREAQVKMLLGESKFVEALSAVASLPAPGPDEADPLLLVLKHIAKDALVSRRRSMSEESDALQVDAAAAAASAAAGEAGGAGTHATVNSILSCICCFGLLTRPRTMQCGHTLCGACYQRLGKCPLPGKTCRNDVGESLRQRYGMVKDPVNLSVNLTLAGLVEDKLYPGELEAAALRAKGNDALKQGDAEGALSLYQGGIEKSPRSHMLFGNKAQVLLSMGRFHEAVGAADEAMKLCPDWPKPYFRKGSALEAMGDVQGALAAFGTCSVLLDEQVKRTGGYGATQTDSKSSDDNLLRIARSIGRDLGDDGWASITVASLTSPSETHSKWDSGGEEGAGREWLESAVSVEDEDLECKLCFSVLYEPTTCHCGHSFCRSCLVRTLDHIQQCPYCRASLRGYLAEHREGGHLLDNIKYCPRDDRLSALITAVSPSVAQQRRSQIAESEAAASANNSMEGEDVEGGGAGGEGEWIPVFVCNIALPTVKCPLHVFEPRYRLMLRRCIASTSQFGMATPAVIDGQRSFDEYGTLLQIQTHAFTSDGRSHVDCIGVRRFRVLERGERDGYATARVQWVEDDDDDVDGDDVDDDEPRGGDGNEAGGRREGSLDALHEQAKEVVNNVRRTMGESFWVSLQDRIGEAPIQSPGSLSFWLLGILMVITRSTEGGLHGGPEALEQLACEIIRDTSERVRLRKVIAHVNQEGRSTGVRSCSIQ